MSRDVPGQRSLSRDIYSIPCPGTKGHRDKENVLVPGQRDSGTTRPGLSRDVPSHGNPSSNLTDGNRKFCYFLQYALQTPFSLPSQRNFPISFKPKVTIGTYVLTENAKKNLVLRKLGWTPSFFLPNLVC